MSRFVPGLLTAGIAAILPLWQMRLRFGWLEMALCAVGDRL